MWLTRLTISAEKVIDLADAKAHLRLLETDNDVEVQSAIDAAHAFLDVDLDGFGGLGFPLIAQSWSMKLSGWRGSAMAFPFTRVTGISQVAYFNDAGASTTVPASDYGLAMIGRTPCVALMSGKSWPAAASRHDAVEVKFTAGFATAATVPDDVKAAARLLVGHFFENRSAVIEGSSQEVPLGVDRLTARYRRYVA